MEFNTGKQPVKKPDFKKTPPSSDMPLTMFQRGEQAAYNGLTPQSNPYPFGNAYYFSWLDGYRKGYWAQHG